MSQYALKRTRRFAFAACGLLTAALGVACGASSNDPAASSGGASGGTAPTGGASTGGASAGVCSAGQLDCGGGCVDVQANASHCGQCRNVCAAGQLCQTGACVCQPGRTNCSGACVDTASDGSNCGECGKACAPGLFCSASTCSDSCGSGLTPCGNACADVMTSLEHCGACNQACTGPQSCVGGTCTCPSGQTLCAGSCVNTASDAGHCGACGAACASGQSCQAGSCAATTGAGGSSAGGSSAGGAATGGATAGTGATDPGGGTATGGADGGSSGTGGAVTGGTAGSGGTATGGAATGGTGGDGTGGSGATATGGTAGTGGSTGSTDGKPGVVIVLPDEVDTSCVPTCVSTTAQVDLSEPDTEDERGEDGPQPIPLGEEDGAPCALSTTGKHECTTGEYPPSFVPPALTGTKKADGFYTQNGKVYDAYGNEFIMRGISNAHIWFDKYGQYLAYDALDNIASYKTNLLRVVWEADGPASLLAEILYRIVELKMVPMVELHDATGKTDTASVVNVAKYWAQPEVTKVAQDYRAYMMINIANEWNGTSNYVDTYQQAIKIIRDAGLEHTIVIDANGYGQVVNADPSTTSGQSQIDSWFGNVTTLMGSDDNLIFSVHLYGWYKDSADLAAIFGRTDIGSTIPFIVGEFAHHHSGTAVDYQGIMQQCQDKKLGWISWSWHGNSSDVADLDLTTDWEGSLTSWGESIFTGTNSTQSAQVASIFQ